MKNYVYNIRKTGVTKYAEEDTKGYPELTGKLEQMCECMLSYIDQLEKEKEQLEFQLTQKIIHADSNN